MKKINQKWGLLHKMVHLEQTKIRKILKELRERTNIICSSLFTSDGFVIEVDQAPAKEDEDYYESVCAICSSIVCLASEGINTFQDDVTIKQISIMAGNQTDIEGFEIILENINDEVILGVMYPNSLNLGVVLFELNNTIQKLAKYFSSVEQDESLESTKASD